MKKRNLILGAIVLISIIVVGIKFKLDLDEISQGFYVEHSLDERNLVVISESASPNAEYTAYHYMFDQGGYGYSKSFWSVVVHGNDACDLAKGLIPDGYRISGWTAENELILEEWEPYYYIQHTEITQGMEINGVKVILKNIGFTE